MGGDLDIYVEQGGDWRPVWRWMNDDKTPIDLTGYAARLQFRPTYDSATVLVQLAANAGITLGQDGSIQVVLAAAATGQFAIDTTQIKLPFAGRIGYRFAVWDLILTSPVGEVTKLLSGNVFLLPGVTR